MINGTKKFSSEVIKEVTGVVLLILSGRYLRIVIAPTPNPSSYILS
jgi:hypothetical protein